MNFDDYKQKKDTAKRYAILKELAITENAIILLSQQESEERWKAIHKEILSKI